MRIYMFPLVTVVSAPVLHGIGFLSLSVLIQVWTQTVLTLSLVIWLSKGCCGSTQHWPTQRLHVDSTKNVLVSFWQEIVSKNLFVQMLWFTENVQTQLTSSSVIKATQTLFLSMKNWQIFLNLIQNLCNFWVHSLTKSKSLFCIVKL